MKKCLPILLFLLMTVFASAQIVINEISYDPPESDQDSLEYIELHNLGATSVDLSGYKFTSGVNLTFDNDIFIEPNGYLVVCESPRAMMTVFGVEGLIWDGALGNGGEAIALKDASGVMVDSLTYDDNAPWPGKDEGTDGRGASIELCDATSDNEDGSSWRAATNDTGMMINGSAVLGTPGAANTVSCLVPADHTVNAMGFLFTPADITIQIGETVRWENTGGNHNVNGGLDVYPNNPEGIFSGAPAAAPWTWDYTFTLPGVYDYHCDLHLGANMVGTVTVEGEVEPPLPLVITEIMYNDPGTEDSLEFVELLNVGMETINLEGLTFRSGLTHTFAAQELAAGEFVVVSKYPDVLMSRLGVASIAWTEGALANGGELLEIVNADGVRIDAVMYDDEGDWSEQADGLGSSLVLCDAASNNNEASSWSVSSYATDITVDGVDIFANPGAQNRCLYDVATVSELNSDGGVVFQGDVRILGRALGVNLNSGGLQFTLTDLQGDGIALYSENNNFGYDEVKEGDLMYVEGSVGQFNGLAQINLDGLDFVSTDGPTPMATVVTSLGEDTESQLVTLVNMHVVNPNEWTGLTSGFNVRITDGSTDTFAIRIDNDVDLYSKGYPQGTFDVTGIGGQFDNSAPRDDGYQLLPRYTADISPYDEFIEEFPEFDIPTITTVNTVGVADSLGKKVTLAGIAHGINWRPSGLQFWIIDDNNNGIQVFSDEDDLGYTMKEGDRLTVKGTIDQFNGQTQIVLAEINVESEGGALVTPLDLSTTSGMLDESLESKYVTTAGDPYTVVDASQWKGDGSSFAFDVANDIAAFTVFVDADTEFANMLTPPGDVLAITGIVGQSDNSEPMDSGYAIWVRYDSDLTVVNDVINTDKSDLVKLYPNPSNGVLHLDTDLDINKIEVLDYTGKQLQLITVQSNQVDISNLVNGSYFLRIHSGDDQFIHRFVKM